jgi:hypothetical protein
VLLPAPPSVDQALVILGDRVGDANPTLLLVAAFVLVSAAVLPRRRTGGIDDTAVSWSVSEETDRRPRRRGPPLPLPV